MGERREHPVAAVLVGLASLAAAFLLSVGALLAFVPMTDAPAEPMTGAGVALVLLAVVALVGGLWSSWRVGAGYWGRRRFLPPPPPPPLFDEPPPPPV